MPGNACSKIQSCSMDIDEIQLRWIKTLNICESVPLLGIHCGLHHWFFSDVATLPYSSASFIYINLQGIFCTEIFALLFNQKKKREKKENRKDIEPQRLGRMKSMQARSLADTVLPLMWIMWNWLQVARSFVYLHIWHILAGTYLVGLQMK